MSEPLLSVRLITYNHAKFIRQAIEGVLMQKVNFSWELVVADDFSTDGTREILLEFKKRFPDFIRLILQKKNVGPARNFLDLISAPQSKYIAYFEGDDYWIDPNKLQKQVDFLEANPLAAACFHDVIAIDENGNTVKANYYESPQETYDQRDSITKHGGRYATGSLVLRSLILNNWPAWFVKSPSDYAIDILITEFGHIAYLKGTMGAYRIHSGGSWQGKKPHKNLEQTVSRYRMYLNEPKFRIEYGSHFRENISKFSRSISIAYQKERQWFNQLRYAWYYFRYADKKKMQAFRFLIVAFLFPLKKVNMAGSSNFLIIC
ncbi:MAG: hypothetical protein C0490_11440 [Marivirga sp.]|nr:hypothetical protein [Marivirga sp.]